MTALLMFLLFAQATKTAPAPIVENKTGFASPAKTAVPIDAHKPPGACTALPLKFNAQGQKVYSWKCPGKAEIITMTDVSSPVTKKK